MEDVRVAVDLNGVRTEMDGKAALVATHEGEECRVAILGTASPIELSHMLSSVIESCMRAFVKDYRADTGDALRLIAAALDVALSEEE